MFKDVCRLCLGKNDLLWVFDKKISDNMTDIIKVTSGVEILQTDSVTQMVCGTCCQITLKMYKFRTTSIKNDSDLKAQYAVYNISQLTSAHKKNDIVCQTKKESVIPESKRDVIVHESPEEVEDIVPETTIEDVSTEGKKGSVSPERKKSHSICESKQEPAAATKPPLPPLQLVIKPMSDRYKNAHPSIKELIKTNPNLKIPRDCVNSHVGAYITLLTDEVEEWFKERNYTDEEIAALKKEACEMASKKRKKTEKAETGMVTPDPTPQKKMKLERKEEDCQSNKFNRRKVISDLVEQAKAILATESTKDKTPESIKLCDKPRSSVSSDSSIKSSKKKNTPESEEEITLTSILRSKPRTRRISSSDDEFGGGADNGPPSPQASDSEDELIETPANESRSKDAREERVETQSKQSTSKDVREDRVKTPSKEKENTSKDAREERVKTPSKEKEKEKAPHKDKGATKPESHSGSKLPRFPDEDFEMFTSRPFLRKPKYRVCDNNVLLIDSDSEDEQPPPPPPPSKEDEQPPPSKATSTNSDPIVLDIDSRSSFGDSDKASFTEALDLVPADVSNTPNMSLLAVANKTHTLYTCRVCDSQRQNLWDLKKHMRKRHTKCPFCSKRFKTLDLREEHMKNECGVNKSPIKLKIVKLELVKVDEDEEVRKKYPKAFEVGGDDDDVTPDISDMETDNTTEAPTDENKEPKAPQRDSTIQYDTETEQAVLEIEKFLSYTENVPSKGNTKKKKKNEDVICISDEEPESTEKDDCKPQIKIVDSEILKDINMHTTDFEVLKTILVNQLNIRAMLGRKSYEAVAKNPILNGSTNRVKVFKNLRKHLQRYKIPIQVNYNQEVSVEYIPPKIRKLTKKPDLWSWMTPKQIKPVQSNLRSLLNGQTVSYVAQPPQNTPVLYDGNVRQSVMPTNFSTNSIVCASSTSLVTTNASLVLNGSPSTSTPPIILNGTQAIPSNSGFTQAVTSNSGYTQAIPSNSAYTNFYLVQSALTTLPPQQGPLPVIESVSSAVDVSNEEQPSQSMIATLESITNSLMPMNQTSSSFVSVSQPDNSSFVPVTQSNDLFVPVSHAEEQGISTDQQSFRQQPAIRVKDLKELS